MKKLLTKFVLTPLLYIYFIGLIISGSYFNFQYARENGFIKWFLLGEIVPTSQSTIWPYYAVKHFASSDSRHIPPSVPQRGTQGPPAGQVIASLKQRAWWLPEYEGLNAAVDQAGGSLSAAYRTGPMGTRDVRVRLVRGPGKGLTLRIDLPPEARVSIDPKTGRPQPGTERSVWTFRDHDLDGMPDTLSVEPFLKPGFKDTFTKDGYMVIRDSPDHTGILVQWTIGLAFSTNHFLHGKDSVSP